MESDGGGVAGDVDVAGISGGAAGGLEKGGDEFACGRDEA